MSAPDEISVGRLAVAHGLLSPQAFQRAFAQWRQQSEAGKADEGFGGFLESRGLLAPGEWEQLVHDAGREGRPVSDADLNLIPQKGDQVGPYLLELTDIIVFTLPRCLHRPQIGDFVLLNI